MTPLSAEGKATLSISIPANSREAFYAALSVLKEHDGRLFPSASHLIVEAVIAHAAHVRAGGGLTASSAARPSHSHADQAV